MVVECRVLDILDSIRKFNKPYPTSQQGYLLPLPGGLFHWLLLLGL